MKHWTVPAIIAAAIMGYWMGRRHLHQDPTPAPATAPAETPLSHSPVATSEKASSTSMAKAPQPATPKSAKQRLIAMLASYLDSEKQYLMLLNVAASDVKVQREIFDLLRDTDDPALMQECQILLTGIRDVALLQEVKEAFNREQNPHRRLAWAYVLGGTWAQDVVRPLVLDLLDGGDAKLQERMLQRLWLQSLPHATSEVEVERATARLRLLAQAGENDALRAAAAGSMRGVRKAEDVAFLIETMLQDRSADVQKAAFHSLPSNYQFPSPLLEEQTRAMYDAALDDRREARFRKALADRALQNSGGYEPNSAFVRFLTPPERTILLGIAGRNK